jgi:hypothetical protein
VLSSPSQLSITREFADDARVAIQSHEAGAFSRRRSQLFELARREIGREWHHDDDRHRDHQPD